MKKTLIAFSGGLDSTHLLDRLLRETDDEVHAIRVNFRNTVAIDGRSAKGPGGLAHQRAEEIAVANILNWMQANRRPIASFQTVPLAQYPYGEWSSPAVMRIGAAMMVDGNFDRMVTGRAAENFSSNRGQLATPLYESIWAECAGRGTLEFPLMEGGLGRAHAHAYMPAELVELTMRCFEPTIVGGLFKVCGKCRNCLMNQDAIEMLGLGADADAILDYHLRKKGSGPYAIDNPAADPNYQGGNMPSIYKISPNYVPPEE